MECYKCEGKTKVTYSIAYDGSRFRHRKCSECGYDFWTEEAEVLDQQLVKDAYASRRAYDRKRGYKW